VVAVMDGNRSPGATTAAVALASCWPGEVVLGDCDPSGGDIAPAWRARQLTAGAYCTADTAWPAEAVVGSHRLGV